MPPKAFALLLICIVLLCCGGVGWCADDPDDALMDRLETGYDSASPWRIEADRIKGLHEAEVVEAFGEVTLRRGGDYLQADYARYYRATGWVFLKGNVQARWRGDQLEADEAEFDLKNRVGWLKNGKLYIADPHLYFAGELIRKRWGDTYSFKNAELTACSGDPPAWSFQASEGDITIDGYAKLWSVSLRVKDTPVLYAPAFSVPVKTRRQSGFLNPDIGVSSLLGMQVNLPFFWAIDEESDATFYENVMSKRGFMQGFEYRHHRDLGEKGLWRFDIMHDSKVVETEKNEQSPLDEDGLVRTNERRYWWRSKWDDKIGRSDWLLQLDIDLVSDQNYLREFSAGQSGYNRSREQFLERFGRGLEEKDQNRTSTLLVSRTWDLFGVAGMVEYNQSVEHGHGNTSPNNDPSLQRIPELHGYLYKTSLLDTPLELEATAQMGKYWRREGTRGGRLDFYPRLSLPLESRYGALIPSVGYRQTLYSVERKESLREPESEDQFPTRSIWDARVDGFTEFFNIYQLDAQPFGWTRMKHSIQPRLTYSYIPYVRQAKHPFLDSLDRIDPEHELTYTLTNVLTRKRNIAIPSRSRQPVGASQDAPEDEELLAYGADYLEVLRLRITGGYDFREATRDENVDKYPRRPFNDILADIRLHYNKYVELRSRTWFSPHLRKVTEHEHTLTVAWPTIGEVSLGFDYLADIDEFKRPDRKKIRILRAGIALWPVDRWRLELEYEADMEEEEDVEKMAGLTYIHDCFDITTVYSSTGLEDRFELWLNLNGINFF